VCCLGWCYRWQWLADRRCRRTGGHPEANHRGGNRARGGVGVGERKPRCGFGFRQSDGDGRQRPPSNTNSSVLVTLDKVDGRWLISGFEPI
jgi:hypothetical protein